VTGRPSVNREQWEGCDIIASHVSFPRSGCIVKRWECQICGFVYDEAEGSPDEGLAPGTRWEDIPNDWVCPDCGTSKSEFEMVELVA
jgi:rubredoxin